jgi:hypothetical protein
VSRALAALLGLLALTIDAGAAQRSSKARIEFLRSNPCPSTDKTRGPCPGYVIDHVRPLCAGGEDRPANMQWQTIAAAKEKDRAERESCRTRRQ